MIDSIRRGRLFGMFRGRDMVDMLCVSVNEDNPLKGEALAYVRKVFDTLTEDIKGETKLVETKLNKYFEERGIPSVAKLEWVLRASLEAPHEGDH